MNKISLICALLMFKPLVVYAESGSCAPVDENGKEIGSCRWTLEGDTLTFSGNGPMKDYGMLGENGMYRTDAPWNDLDMNRDTGSLFQIKNVIVENGITSVGRNALRYSGNNFDNIIIGDDVKTIGQDAFYNCSVKNLKLGKNLETLGVAAFRAGKITNLVLPENLKNILDLALGSVQDTSIILPGSVEYVKASGLPVKSIQTLYCEPKNEAVCQQVISEIKDLSSHPENLSYKIYTKALTPDGNRYIIDGVRYKSIEDFQNGKPVKLIYTVEEAMEATKNGTRFHVGLTYK